MACPAGTYKAIAHVGTKEKSHKQVAQCSATFTVKDSPLPTIRCSANPTTVNPGDASVISSYVTTIPQRKLVYAYTATAGQINGTRDTTELQTGGVPPGVITVGCQVKGRSWTDGIGNNGSNCFRSARCRRHRRHRSCAHCTSSATSADRHAWTTKRAPASTTIALTLHNQPDSRLVVLGEHDVNEPEGQLLAAERVINTRAYLSKEKGIDPSRCRYPDFGDNWPRCRDIPAGTGRDVGPAD